MSPTLWSIAIFLALGAASAALLHQSLKRHGRIFLDELFRHHPPAGRALVRLLDIGYLVFNVGYLAQAASSLNAWRNDEALEPLVRGIATALGWQMLLLSVIHGINIALFSRRVGRALRESEREVEELLRS